MQTPHLVVDEARLEANLTTMATRCATAGVALRPHAKTHKGLQVARRQLAAGAVGLTVATIGEAEVFAAVADSLFIAYPVWVSAASAARLSTVAESTHVQVGIASVDGARNLARYLPGFEVLVEIDSGHHRTGVRPAEASEVAAAATRAGLRVVGVFTFPGHGYSPDARARAARDEADALSAAAAGLRSVGIEPRVVSGGSTPTIEYADPGVVTEVRPGVYPFMDAQQVELGTAGFDQVALWATATVIHRATGPGSIRAVLDAGSKILGADRPAWTTGFGRLLDHPEARITSLSEHHAVVDFDASYRMVPELGDQVRVVPNHVCNAVNLVDVVRTTDGEVWAVDARGRNS